MKLVFTCRNLTLLGGQSRIAWELAQQASKDGHEVNFVAHRFPAGGEELPGKAHRVFQLPRGFGPWRFRSFASLASRKAARVAGDDGIVHGFGDSYGQHILTLGNVDWNYSKHIPGRQPGTAAVHIKKTAFLDPGLRFLVLVSEQMRRDVSDLLPDFDPDKVRVIYPGVDPDRFSAARRDDIRAHLAAEHGIRADAVWLVFAAGGDFEKRNMATLGAALMKLRPAPDWRMIFVGPRAGQFPWPRELAERTHFLGRWDDIGGVLPGCDALVYPAWYDESPLVCLESMASGLPLVVSSKVGTGEILSAVNRQAGILQDPADVEGLAFLVQRLIDDEPLRRSISEENRRAARSFTWEKVYARYRELYDRVATELAPLR